MAEDHVLRLGPLGLPTIATATDFEVAPAEVEPVAIHIVDLLAGAEAQNQPCHRIDVPDDISPVAPDVLMMSAIPVEEPPRTVAFGGKAVEVLLEDRCEQASGIAELHLDDGVAVLIDRMDDVGLRNRLSPEVARPRAIPGEPSGEPEKTPVLV